METTHPSVQRALALRPFKPVTTRRDLSTSFRAYSTAWTTLDHVAVLTSACRRLGERAAEVLLAVHDKLKELDDEEKAANEGKVVLERSYEFRREGSEDGQGGQGGLTKLKIQSCVLLLPFLPFLLFLLPLSC
jgi:hypothetical protein